MTKYIIGVVLGVVLVGSTAFAATSFSERFPRGEIIGVVKLKNSEQAVYKLKDGDTTCYVYATSIDCLK